MIKILISGIIIIITVTVGACASSSTTDVSQAPTNSAPAPANNGYKNISQEEMAQLMKEGVPLIDVRRPEEYKSGHVPGAKLVPLGTLSAAAANWDKQKKIIVICQTGSRSAGAANYLVNQGFTNVYNFPRGTMGYNGQRTMGMNAK
ncbi:MAG TPA: rhodanese-like domain-containing protein [Actinobacteria bacterium]|nr:rhodanese-like domain-containing protein [Actinomycetes bacterium]HEX21452.1 rhodanese-like domain-containing protein [Actinomycetota bacterium]